MIDITNSTIPPIHLLLEPDTYQQEMQMGKRKERKLKIGSSMSKEMRFDV
jgi:hypothetical protein